MRVHRDRLVGPFECRRVRDVVGIETDVAVPTLEARLVQPVRNHPQLGGAVAILAEDLRMHALIKADNRAGADHVVEAETQRDGVGVEAVGSGGEDEAAALRLVARDGGAGAGADVRSKLGVGEAVDERLQVARVDLGAEQEPVVDFL